ncbi:MAG TPA: DNA-formamidopyrimidine glycosylase family protein, partial [Phycisphaerales bacterium]|nr:DNA-formamidopyrimidine glycosylase family protein [Phycisphaerales bacterium]
WRIRVHSPFLLRTFEPPIESIETRRVIEVSRLGKRIVLGFEEDLFAVIHLMIAGRFRWEDGPPKWARASGPAGRWLRPPKIELARMEFEERGTLVLTEASQKKRAALHMVAGREGLGSLAAVGLDVLTSDLGRFAKVLTSEHCTLKRALTTPRLFDGIGNAYSDEILHTAGLSPMQLTGNLSEGEIERLHMAARGTLTTWIGKLRTEFGLDDGIGRFPGPGEITAFRPDFAVHGKYNQPCPVCGTKVQRIVYAENECNYCPRCQTQGRLLADRARSRLLKDDWPRTIEELEGL